MQDRNEFQLHTHRIEPARQHYAQANSKPKPRFPVWLALLVIVACIGIAGRFAS